VTLVYVIAGEASGDVLGARLIAALRARRPGLQFAGIGGDRMAELGVPSLFDFRELALMGLLEVLPNIRRLARRLDETVADIMAKRPALVVTIDSPGFTLRVAERVKAQGIPVVHYVAPQVWAWRQKRVLTLKRKVDRILCLLPFEPVFFERAGVPVTFVGHPVLESGVDAGDAARFRNAHGIGPEERPVIVMPGSRRMEVSRLLPIFGEALRIAEQRVPGLRPVVPVAPVVADAVRRGTGSWPVQPILTATLQDKHDAYAAASAALIKSGTSSLEMAVARIPHVVGYRLNPVTAAIMTHLIKVRFASIVNLLADRMLVQERIHTDCKPEILAADLLRVLTDDEARAEQRAGFDEVLAMLRPPEGRPSEAAAAAVLAELDAQA